MCLHISLHWIRFLSNVKPYTNPVSLVIFYSKHLNFNGIKLSFLSRNRIVADFPFLSLQPYETRWVHREKINMKQLLTCSNSATTTMPCARCRASEKLLYSWELKPKIWIWKKKWKYCSTKYFTWILSIIFDFNLITVRLKFEKYEAHFQ